MKKIYSVLLFVFSMLILSQAFAFDFNPCDSVHNEANQLISDLNSASNTLNTLSTQFNKIKNIYARNPSAFENVRYGDGTIIYNNKTHKLTPTQIASLPLQFQNNPTAANAALENIASIGSGALDKKFDTAMNDGEKSIQDAKNTISTLSTVCLLSADKRLSSVNFPDVGSVISNATQDVCEAFDQSQDPQNDCQNGDFGNALAALGFATIDIISGLLN